MRASGELEVSKAASTPRPPVRSRMAPAGSLVRGSTVSQAPNALARARRSGLTSSAITRAPIAAASWVADRPTGPWPKIAIVSLPDSLARLSAP